jgi:hypothetical protein
VVLFDEYFNYANWEQHQFKAFQEFVQEHDVKYVYLGFARQQVAVRIVIDRRGRCRAMTAPFSADVIMTPAAERLHSADDAAAPGQHAPLDLTVFISCYNEEQYIVATIQTVRDALNEIGSISYEIIVIDDCSKDGSSALVTQLYRGTSGRARFASHQRTQPRAGTELSRCRLHRKGQILPLGLRRQCRTAGDNGRRISRDSATPT